MVVASAQVDAAVISCDAERRAVGFAAVAAGAALVEGSPFSSAASRTCRNARRPPELRRWPPRAGARTQVSAMAIFPSAAGSTLPVASTKAWRQVPRPPQR